jgi:hypothetical protein
MKIGEVKTVIRENAAVARAGYGKGFWILIFGMTLAATVVCQMELSRARPVVERIPASEAAEVTANIK